jgi:hypothetical protein
VSAKFQMIIHRLRMNENGTAYIHIGLHLQHYIVVFKREQVACYSKLLLGVSDNRTCLYPYVRMIFLVAAAPSMMAV